MLSAPSAYGRLCDQYSGSNRELIGHTPHRSALGTASPHSESGCLSGCYACRCFDTDRLTVTNSQTLPRPQAIGTRFQLRLRPTRRRPRNPPRRYPQVVAVNRAPTPTPERTFVGDRWLGENICRPCSSSPQEANPKGTKSEVGGPCPCRYPCKAWDTVEDGGLYQGNDTGTPRPAGRSRMLRQARWRQLRTSWSMLNPRSQVATNEGADHTCRDIGRLAINRRSCG